MAADEIEMSTILLVGSDFPLIEGLAQTLGTAGHRPVIAHSLTEGLQLASAERPLVAVVERALALAGGDVQRLSLAPGGAVLLYRTGPAPMPLPASLLRVVLADLTLPLERHRLVALVQSVRDRAVAAGRGHVDTPAEDHPRL